MRRSFIFILFVWSSVVFASQKSFNIRKEEHKWHFDYQWMDKSRQPHQTKFGLNSSSILTDLERSLRISVDEVAQYEATAVNDWAKHQPNVRVVARVEGGGVVRIAAEGKDPEEVQRVLQRAEYIRKEGREKFLQQVGYKEYSTGVAPDYIKMIKEYSPELSPLAYALGGSNGDFRGFVQEALSFVQNIPYEDTGAYSYRRPLSLLAKNQGDCDSKVVLFLALIHNAYPDVPLAVLSVPGHALSMIGMPPKGKEKAYRIEDQIWVPAEPVGPALLPMGTMDKGSLTALQSGRFSLLRL